jgi:hypothetical protein
MCVKAEEMELSPVALRRDFAEIRHAVLDENRNSVLT